MSVSIEQKFRDLNDVINSLAEKAKYYKSSYDRETSDNGELRSSIEALKKEFASKKDELEKELASKKDELEKCEKDLEAAKSELQENKDKKLDYIYKKCKKINEFITDFPDLENLFKNADENNEKIKEEIIKHYDMNHEGLEEIISDLETSLKEHLEQLLYDYLGSEDEEEDVSEDDADDSDDENTEDCIKCEQDILNDIVSIFDKDIDYENFLKDILGKFYEYHKKGLFGDKNFDEFIYDIKQQIYDNEN